MECKSKGGNPSIVREGSAHPSGAKRWCISESLRNQVYPRVVNPVVYFHCLVDVNPVLSNRLGIGVVPLSYKVGRLFPSKNRIPRPTLQESYLRRQNPEGNSESFHRYLPSLLRWVYPGFQGYFLIARQTRRILIVRICISTKMDLCPSALPSWVASSSCSCHSYQSDRKN